MYNESPEKDTYCFKPYYKWNTFNTIDTGECKLFFKHFKPYYKWNTFNTNGNTKNSLKKNIVLNLIINGIPSILKNFCLKELEIMGFKPYYKWNTFNT